MDTAGEGLMHLKGDVEGAELTVVVEVTVAAAETRGEVDIEM